MERPGFLKRGDIPGFKPGSKKGEAKPGPAFRARRPLAGDRPSERGDGVQIDGFVGDIVKLSLTAYAQGISGAVDMIDIGFEIPI